MNGIQQKYGKFNLQLEKIKMQKDLDRKSSPKTTNAIVPKKIKLQDQQQNQLLDSQEENEKEQNIQNSQLQVDLGNQNLSCKQKSGLSKSSASKMPSIEDMNDVDLIDKKMQTLTNPICQATNLSFVSMRSQSIVSSKGLFSPPLQSIQQRYPQLQLDQIKFSNSLKVEQNEIIQAYQEAQQTLETNGNMENQIQYSKPKIQEISAKLKQNLFTIQKNTHKFLVVDEDFLVLEQIHNALENIGQGSDVLQKFSELESQIKNKKDQDHSYEAIIFDVKSTRKSPQEAIDYIHKSFKKFANPCKIFALVEQNDHITQQVKKLVDGVFYKPIQSQFWKESESFKSLMKEI